MSDLKSVGLHDRIRDWTGRLEQVSMERIPASGLYAGDHWKIALRIPEAATGALAVRLWVASAGYGLVSIETPLKPYSATFIRAHAEAVAPAASQYTTRDWWREMSAWAPEGYSEPRTLGELTLSFTNNDVLLLAMSEPYAQALREDIDAAESHAPGRVALVSVGLASAVSTSHPVSLLPVEARLKQTLRGAMQGVNARIAEAIVREHARWFPSTERLRAVIREWVDAAPALPTYDRAEQTDEDVRQYIRERARAGAANSKSEVLRALRDSGRACGQERLGRLYREVIDASPSIAPTRMSSATGDTA
jgi:hypothetical protein